MGIVSYIKSLFKKDSNDVIAPIPAPSKLDKAPLTFAERMAEIDAAFDSVFKNTELVSLPEHYDTIVERGPSTRILSIKQRLEELEIEEEMKKKRVSTAQYNFPISTPEWFLNQDYKYKPSAAEKLIITELSKYPILYYTEVSFKGLVSPKGGLLRFDFMVQVDNKMILIEYDGAKYHNTHDVRIRDTIKTEYCKYHNIKLIRLNKEHYYNIPKYIKQIITGTFK